MTADVTGRVISLAAQQVGKGTYRKDATLAQAPGVVNCFTFVQWLWSHAGITVPDHILRWDKAIVVSRETIRPGDLAFTPLPGRTLETDDFGHVGIVGADGWIIHASGWRGMIGADSQARFFERGCLGVRRVPLSR